MALTLTRLNKSWIISRLIFAPFPLVAIFAILIMALSAYQKGRSITTFIQGCDPFGYSRMADVIRNARSSGQSADFFIRDDQTRWLIEKFKQSGLPSSSWDEVVTAHAHHYFPGSDEVGPQYPPGTGWTLSFFPKTDAVRDLNLLTILILAIGSILVVFWCTRNGLPFSCLMIAGAVCAFFSVYQWIDNLSFSINATLLPLFLGTFSAGLATLYPQRMLAILLGLASGILFGLVIQTRLASVLLIPAIALIFVPRKIHLLFWYLAGVTLNGVVPLLFHNKTITGSFAGATYNSGDTRQSFSCIPTNLSMYLHHAKESSLYYVLYLCMGLCLLILVILATSSLRTPQWRLWATNHYGLAMAPACAFFLTAVYFLTHFVLIIYYLVPGMLLVGLLIAFLFVSLEIQWRKLTAHSQATRVIGGLAAMTISIAALVYLSSNYTEIKDLARTALTSPEEPPFQFNVPAELLDAKAWIWADTYSSSIDYYTAHSSFKLPFSTPQMRKLMYAWIKSKGDSQYMIADSDGMKKLVGEAQALGWKLTYLGDLRGAPYYKMEMP